MRVKYFVDKEEGVVVCLGVNVGLDVFKDLGVKPNTVDIFSPENMQLIIRDKFKGKAKISKEDKIAGVKFDEELGKKLAYQKMQSKYLKAKERVVRELLEDVNEAKKSLEEVLDVYDITRIAIE